MEKKASFFVGGALVLSLFLPSPVFGMIKHQITVSAIVLEHLTFIKKDRAMIISTNSDKKYVEVFVKEKIAITLLF